MEIKGEEFIRKVQIQQEKEELEQKLSELEEVESKISSAATSQQAYPSDNNMNVNSNEFDSLMIDEAPSNDDNKKKYLILGIVLVVLFLLTIIIIRLLTDDSKTDEFTTNKKEPTTVVQKEEKDNIEENFQKIMNERVKKINEDKKEVDTSNNSEEKINALNNNSSNIPDEMIDETIKKIEETKEDEVVVIKKATPKPKPKPVVKKVEKKPTPKPVVKKETKKSVKDLVSSVSSSSTAPKGHFVQIGAFSKKPSGSYIKKIRNAGFKYKIYQVEVKGKIYNKVLIGPYSSRAAASENLDSIKSKLNLTSAYILRF